MHEKKQILPVPSQEFMASLRENEANPHEALIAMQRAYGCDIGVRLGFSPGRVDADPEAVRASRLSLEQYEAIKMLEGLSRVFCGFGIFTPSQVGLWFAEPQEALEDRSPLDVLFARNDEHGFNRQDVCDVLDATGPFMRSVPGVDEAVQRLLEY